MDQFLQLHSDAVVGVVGEVAGTTYVARFGRERVRRVDVIDLVPGPTTTVVADVGSRGSLGTARFDSLIVTQVLQYVPDPGVAVENLVGALRPGGTLLLAVPALAAHDSRESLDSDHWRFWPAGLTHLLREAAPRAACSVAAYGNLLATLAFLHGMAAEELAPAELQVRDDRFPVVVCARVDLPESGPRGG